MEHSEIVAPAIEGDEQPNSVPTSQPSANWPVEAGQVLRQAASCPPKSNQLRPSFSAHTPIWYSIFPASSIVSADACRYGEVLLPRGRSLLRPPLAPPARPKLEGLL